ncbi:monooxygenase [Kosakonia sacchari]|uniref:Monooxygenase n=1 Tax=Kosakonia sacchari TaxID=1158459 RepID=A0ABZ0MW54_9ENTR|nr:monooxygenase [Kosakonia sacchari]WOZ79750.1 monooxygenase [Kosakonia sacchari]
MKLTARLMARLHLFLALIWAVLTIPTLLWWKNSILWVSLMSIYAIVISHLAAYSAAHAEKAASQALNESDQANKKISANTKEIQGQ